MTHLCSVMSEASSGKTKNGGSCDWVLGSSGRIFIHIHIQGSLLSPQLEMNDGKEQLVLHGT